MISSGHNSSDSFRSMHPGWSRRKRRNSGALFPAFSICLARVPYKAVDPPSANRLWASSANHTLTERMSRDSDTILLTAELSSPALTIDVVLLVDSIQTER